MDTKNCPHSIRSAAGSLDARRAVRSSTQLALRAIVCVLCVTTTGCFAWVRSVQTSVVCKPDAAREAGQQDALAGDPPNENYAEICGVAEPSLNRMYREAYDAVDAGSRGSQRSLLPRLFR